MNGVIDTLTGDLLAYGSSTFSGPPFNVATQTLVFNVPAGAKVRSAGATQISRWNGSAWVTVAYDSMQSTDVSGALAMLANTVATVIVSVSQFVKVLGTTTAVTLNGFAHSNNRLTYTGSERRMFWVDVNASVQSASNNRVLGFALYKNGILVSGSRIITRTEGNNSRAMPGISVPVMLAQGDYIEVWGTNDTNASNFTVNEMQVVVR